MSSPRATPTVAATADPELEPTQGLAQWQPAWPTEVCPEVEVDSRAFRVTVCGCSAQARCRLEKADADLPPTLVVELDEGQPVACRDCVRVEARCPVESIPDLSLINGRVPFAPWMQPNGQRSLSCEVDDPGEIEADLGHAASVALMTASDIQADCSGIGGWHTTFTVAETLAGKRVQRADMVHQGTGPPYRSGQLFVGLLSPLSEPRPRPAAPGLCLDEREPVDADVLRLIPVDSTAQARRLLALWAPGGRAPATSE